jgi:site-specific recombinase XerD
MQKNKITGCPPRTFYENQVEKGLKMKTAKQQNTSVNQFLEWCKLYKIIAKTASYNDVMHYVDHLKSINNVHQTQLSKLKALSHYFDFLGVKINVANLVKLQGGTRETMYFGLEKQELLAIFEAQKTYGLAKKRDQIVLSLVIFQGLQSEDFERIEIKDIDLELGTVFVPGSYTLNARVLPLAPVQILLFSKYLSQIRPAMLEGKSNETEQFIVNYKGKYHKMKSLVFSILKPLKHEFPQLKNSTQIRQTLIADWVKTHGVRQAQYMAGHKFVSSTERYNENKMEGLRDEINIFHPF